MKIDKKICDFCLKEKEKDIENLSLKVHTKKEIKKQEAKDDDYRYRSFFMMSSDDERTRKDEVMFHVCFDCQRKLSAVLLDNRGKFEELRR